MNVFVSDWLLLTKQDISSYESEHPAAIYLPLVVKFKLLRMVLAGVSQQIPRFHAQSKINYGVLVK